jgi:hypothetical protein
MATNETTIRIGAVDATKQAFQSVQGNLNGLTSKLKGIAGPLAAAFSVGAITAFSKSLIDTANQLQDISDRTGVAASDLSRLGVAAKLNASSQEEVNDAVQKLSKSIAEASKGTGAQADAFASLGIKVKDASGNIRPTIDIFNDISNSFAGAEDGAVKLKIAQDLLGRSGSNLIPLLNQGSNALGQYKAQFSEEFIQQAADFNNNLDKLIIRFKTLSATILGPVVTALNNFFEYFEDDNQKKVDRFIGSSNVLSDRLRNGVASSARFSAEEINLLGTVTDKLTKKTLKLKQTTDDYQLDDWWEAVRLKIRDVDEAFALEVPSDFIDFFDVIKEKVAELDYQTSIAKTGLEQYIEETKNLSTQLDGVAVRSLQTIENTLAGVFSGTVKVKDAFKNMASSIIADLARIQIQRMITGPLADFLFSSTGGDLTKSPLGTGITPRALGGQVQRNAPYMVGERGPELFVPGSSGSIVPNRNLSGNGGVVINQVMNIDASADRASIARALEANRRQTIADINELMRRNSPQLARM